MTTLRYMLVLAHGYTSDNKHPVFSSHATLEAAHTLEDGATAFEYQARGYQKLAKLRSAGADLRGIEEDGWRCVHDHVEVEV